MAGKSQNMTPLKGVTMFRLESVALHPNRRLRHCSNKMSSIRFDPSPSLDLKAEGLCRPLIFLLEIFHAFRHCWTWADNNGLVRT